MKFRFIAIALTLLVVVGNAVEAGGTTTPSFNATERGDVHFRLTDTDESFTLYIVGDEANYELTTSDTTIRGVVTGVTSRR